MNETGMNKNFPCNWDGSNPIIKYRTCNTPVPSWTWRTLVAKALRTCASEQHRLAHTSRHICLGRGMLIFTTKQFTLTAYRATFSTLLLLKFYTSTSPIPFVPLQLGGSALAVLTLCLKGSGWAGLDTWDPGQYLCFQQTFILLQCSSVFPL